MKKKVLILTINETIGKVPEYQRILYETAVLGVENVIFVYEPNESINNRIYDMAEKLNETCEILGLDIKNTFVRLNSEISLKNFITTIDEDNRITLFTKTIFEEFKDTEENKQKLLSRDRLGNILVKRIQNK